MKTISSILEEAARKKRARIAIGGDDNRVQEAAEVTRDFADVTLVGDDLVDMLETVDGAVRGTLGSDVAMEDLKASFPGFLARAAIIEIGDHSFLLSPVGIDEGWTWQERTAIGKEAGKLLGSLGMAPKIAVLAGGRQGDRGRGHYVDRTLEEARLIVEKLGPAAKDHTILIEEALAEGANVIVPPSGVIGNYIFRTLVLVAGAKGHGAPVLGIDRIFVDTSRSNTKEGYIRAITTAAGLANLLGR